MAERSESGYGSDFYAVIGKALAEPEFRETLRSAAYRREELEKMGITLTPDQDSELDRAIEAVDALAQQFGIGIAAT